MSSAQNILISDIESYLAASLAKNFVEKGQKVYGVGKSPVAFDNLLENPNFTLLELDLTQPLPFHLPKLDAVFYLGLIANPASTAALKNLISAAQNSQTQIFIFAHTGVEKEALEKITRLTEDSEEMKLFLVGDIYGPLMPVADKKIPAGPKRAFANDHPGCQDGQGNRRKRRFEFNLSDLY